tara:strand:+ start:414 stop:668 length:255 start_codon:yes stop_codon:yes gene_type:complete
MYSITYSLKASKQIKKLSKNLKERIISTIERCRIRPYSHVKKLIGNKNFSLRVGNYRIIIDIKETELRVFVIEVGHRKNIYKNQ